MKKSVICSLISAALALVLCLLFGMSAADGFARAHEQTSILENGNFDITVKNPSAEQVNSSLAAEFEDIEKVVPYYLFLCGVSAGGKSGDESVVLFEDFGSLANTPYNADRIVEGKTETAENSAVADMAFCQKYGVGVGDAVSVAFGKEGTLVEFKVCAVSETSPMEGGEGTLAVQYTGRQKELVEESRTVPLTYTGAFIKCKAQPEETAAALKKTYKPLGIKKDESQFESHSQYEAYLKEFNETDHSYLVKGLSESLQMDDAAANESAARANVWVMTAIAVVGILLIDLFYLFSQRKKVSKAVRDGRALRAARKKYASFWEPLLTAVLGIGVSMLVLGLRNAAAGGAYGFGILLGNFAALLIGIAGAAAAAFAVSLAFVAAARPKKQGISG